jgi:hypothetical protein
MLLDLNCTPPEDSDSRIIPGEGNFAAHHEDVNTLAQDEGGDSLATGISSASAYSSLLCWQA